MKSVLVTGASGYIGSILVPWLLNHNYKVIAVDRFFFGDNLDDHPNLIKLKLDSRQITKEQLKGVFAVIDLVAISNDPSGDLFENITMDINCHGRLRCATLAKEVGVQRYILPSSCSIYGFQEGIVDENSETNALTTYAQANELAERQILPLSDENFCVTVIRQATIYGYSPRMRFDLAINGMVYGAFSKQILPLMRNGKQYRPMLHVEDTADIMCQLLQADVKDINGQVFNAGSNAQNYQLSELAIIVKDTFKEHLNTTVDIEMYGDPDHRSYQVNFDKIKSTIGWEPKWDAKKAVVDLSTRLNEKTLTKTPQSITLNWYKQLLMWDDLLENIKLDGKLFKL
ncbi:SDR family oxidoreductase [Pseudoalteromonas sp. L23]|uniref:NAD-dependent epimerase/dehydratase family protein n=1 Tax=unclassified Pseudoalteromonas TaxID=194690 RepID=UPI001EF09D23|nr:MULTISPECIES: SDR family oxidoreductase [unclassified Pseudoalteromonas]MCF7514992.1 SDR family oxidoreductase [Pseudoalteromonas sp. L7]MCF7527084.1 SDR family oxidoreductase [Pseudoalteromonas sp. L23]MCX2767492.1 SDR family oxidoreductase [Pseudoalteromonas sp. B530]